MLGLDFTVSPALSELPVDMTVPPEDAVLQIARGKAEEVAALYPDSPVLGADTAVVIGNEILGKPLDVNDAKAMLRRLSGNTHRVITAVWLCNGEKSGGFADVAQVQFAPMTQQEIDAYVASGEPMDKAGAYAVQGMGMRFVSGIHGDFYTVMGLPSARLYAFLKERL